MEKVIAKPRESVSQYAPKMILANQTGANRQVIGSAEKLSKRFRKRPTPLFSLTTTGRRYNRDSLENVQKAAATIDGMTREIKIGEVYDGTWLICWTLVP